jgi:hypothetical protein
MVQIEHQIGDLTLDKVLEAVLLALVHKFLSGSILADDRVPGTSCSSYVVPTWDSHFSIEVYKASCAPAQVLLCEVITDSI